ncbi:glycoside hydrolase family 3 C-terminal domain-containing protein [Subdoligranulum sp. DSM 109015]|uniref:Glycoside hydrolase family 3 C-terminal domain-containing protein n=1 Tax=Gemmiger gallinarum TaxID=2779354 RepID=A0ABR9R3R1_9FIRM|nr:glycoside hydrolase family 3 N-terminal domain-containing protein [Gemmiger gallinarum]MBE5037764.1 glycoside hydrolase family 3 C-terminal domain-containing protein [Gemmiger gallinarum]
MGWSFYYPSTGGSGSGAVGSDGLVSPKEALAAAGIQINEALETYYLNWSNEHYTEWMVTKANGYYTDEDTNTSPARPSVSKAYQAAWDVPELNGQLVAEACDQSDAAANNVQIVWIGRGGGEYHDCPTVMTKEGGSVNTYGVNPDKHYLELTDEEEAVLAKAKELRGENGKVIVIINANNTMELGELQDDDRVDAILFVGGPGKQGFYAIGDVLNGTVNPSGRLADTYAADLLASPAMENFSSKVYYDADAAFPNQYDTMIDYTDADGSTSQRPILFVGYEEGIYVGYRFYETAAADGFFTSAQLPAGVTDPYYNRENGVIYPFGYGLSYTTFTQELTKATYSDGVFTFEVKVTNTGSVAGKDVVELYVETPYTPGGIEKSKVVLCGFDKTDILQPGADQTMTIRVEAEDLASYDDTVNQCYVLDAGDCTFYLGTVNGTVYGSHSWAYATPADSASLTAGANAVTFAAANAISETKIYNDEHDGKRASDETTATNAFTREMTGNNLKVANGDATMNRAAGFAASWPTAPQAEDTVMPQELKDILNDNNYSTKEATALHDEDVEMPVTGKNAGLQLIDLRGLSFDDPLWETYIQQWKPEEMALLLGKAGFQTEAFTQYGKPTTLDNDGPQAFRHQALGEENEKIDTYYMTAFPCEALLACTWNEDLLEEIGQNVGAEGSVNGMSGWYAPGLNTHRTAFGGRNFEYFSEDPFLAGKLAAREIAGAAQYGVFTYIKHFAMNEQEAFCRSWCCGMHMDDSLDRYQNPEWMLMTWANEQTVREIYLKAFEIAIKEATVDLKYLDSEGNEQVAEDFRCATGVMTAFCCVGNTWSGGNHALLQTVLRDEWGFDGTALTDYALHDFMYPDQMIRNGGTACLQSNRKDFVDQNNPSATTVKYLQKATHEMCYMVANSNAMNGMAPGSTITYSLAPWEMGCAVAIVVTGLLFAAVIVLSVLRVRDEKRHPDRYHSAKSL